MATARPVRLPFGPLYPLLALFLMVACGDSPTEPANRPTLLGGWIIERNAGIWGVDGGGFAFAEDGTATISGATFSEGEYTVVERTGTWTADASFGTAVLTFDGRTTRWELRFSPDHALFLETSGDLRWFRLIRPMPD